jgi:UDP-N-acetylmuramoyl-L-alanyl-D-glutamate--2,6-diaminopimelate ligase
MSGRQFKLAKLLDGFAADTIENNVMVSGLAIDSRRVVQGDLFLAMRGVASDGRRFIQQAIEQGAAAVVYESDDDYIPEPLDVPHYPIRHLDQVAGLIADRYYGSPSRRATVIGVTGTNGKTTCTHLLAQSLDHGDNRCAVIGTLGNGFPGKLDSTLHTTPDVVTVHELIARYIESGASHVCIEVSSHALQQGRVNGIAFDIAVFTNLSRDHLDYHGDMESYGAAKASLFAMPGLKVAVINQDDDFGKQLLAGLGMDVRAVSYGIEAGDFQATAITAAHEGIELTLATPMGAGQLTSQLFGRFNAANLLAAMAVLVACNLSLEEAIARLTETRPVAGRMERFGGHDTEPLVVVDYAHTPDALEKVLLALREHTRESLWCIFGCGGDRDRGKRPQMGAVAERLADHIVLTDDNPRHEDPDQIIAEIQSGMQREHKIIHKRKDAISSAVDAAGVDDIILLAGKGHEDYQQVGDQRIAYSDRETVREILGEAA